MLKGIDVSEHQKTISWASIPSDIGVALIRCGVRGYYYGNIQQDATCATNIQGVKSKGIHNGLYFFSQAINVTEAIEEAKYSVKLAQLYNLNCDAGIWFDSEMGNAGTGRADNLSVSARTACAKAFCDTVAGSGYTTGIYASTSWFGSKLDMSQLNYPIWVADYRGYNGYKGDKKVYGWQYSSNGAIDGISGRVDMNEWYQEFETKQMYLSNNAVKMYCFATGSDNAVIVAKMKELGIAPIIDGNTIISSVAVTKGDQYNLFLVTEPLGIKWNILYEALSNDSVFMQIFATGGDALKVKSELESLNIKYTVSGNEITTAFPVTKGDQVNLVKWAAESNLGLVWKIYTPPKYKVGQKIYINDQNTFKGSTGNIIRKKIGWFYIWGEPINGRWPITDSERYIGKLPKPLYIRGYIV